MSKEILLNAVDLIKKGIYKWNLYFVKIDRRNLNPYYVYKHTFRKPSYLPDYMVELSNSMEKFQIETLEKVSDYNGENSKTICDKLCVNNELIKEQWENLQNSVCGAPREQIKGKYQGYILCGQAAEDGMSDIVIGKMGNPIISLERKNEKVFRHTAEGELDDITDELCRLYLVADFCVIGSNLYAFNCKFETFFHLQKTLHRLKMKSIDQILDYKAFSNAVTARRFMESYPSPKTFLTLKAERVEKLKAEEKRKDLAKLLELKFENGYIVLENQEQTIKLIKYLCYKLFQDKETDNLIEVKQVVNDHVV